MKDISDIDWLNTKYEKYLIGDQARFVNIPPRVGVGKLNWEGEVENNAPASKYIEVPDTVLVGNTSNQMVIDVVNHRYKRLLFSIRQQVAVVSYDWRLMFYRISQGAIYRQLLGDEDTPSNRWFDDAQSSTTPRLYDGLIPYGEGWRIRLECDNNHATDPCTMECAFLFYDPVR